MLFFIMRKWYEVGGILGHQGAGKGIESTNYVFAENIVEAYAAYKKMPAMKKSKTPNVRPLNEEESKLLEIRILQTNRVTLSRAKRFGFYAHW